MALSAAVLRSLIQSNIEAIAGISITQPAQLQAFCQAVADGIVTHITSAAVVNVASVSGVEPGGGSSGPGTGTVS